MAQSLSLDELRYALDQAAIVAATDHRGIITYVNDTFCDISKYTGQELLVADNRLIINACQATGTSPMAIAVSSHAGRCRIAVSDRGPGIPPDVHERVFEPFFTTRPGGTGLGLSIVKRLIELLNGSIVLADRPGGGTVAEIVVPLAPLGTLR